MNELFSTTTLFTRSLSWALLHSLWQGGIIYVCLFILLKTLGNTTAKTRYNISVAALGGLFLWFTDTWINQYQKLKDTTVFITMQGMGATYNTHAAKAAATTLPPNTLSAELAPALEHYFPFIIALYCTSLCLMIMRFCINLRQVHLLRSSGLVVSEQSLNETLAFWKNRLEIGRKVHLYLSARVQVPVMLGTLKPIILLPVATISQLSTDQVEAIIVHELAHIKRFDYLHNILQNITETLLFFNPFVWLVSSLIRKEREHCCDDLVVESMDSPLTYAHALVQLESTRRSAPGMALAATGQKNQLLNRIKRIMEMKKKNINVAQLGIIVLALILIACTVAVFTPAFAQKAKHGSTDSTKTKSSYSYSYTYTSGDSSGNTQSKTITRSSGKPQSTDIAVSFDDDNVYPFRARVYDIIKNDSVDIKKMIKEITIASADVADAIAEIDTRKVDKEIAKARKEIDNIDWDEIQAEIKNGLREADEALNDTKLKKEISVEIKHGLEESRDALRKAKIEIEENRTRQGREEPREVPGGSFEKMLTKMEKDGIINRAHSFIIKKEDDELYINGEKQPDNIYNRYKHYLNYKKISIKGRKGQIKISATD